MKEQLLAEILKIIESTKDFTLEQAPQYAREVVTLGIIQGSAWFIIFSALFIWAIDKYKAARKELDEISQHKDETWVTVRALFSALLMAAMFVGAGLSLDRFTEAVFAPRSYILKQLIPDKRCNK